MYVYIHKHVFGTSQHLRVTDAGEEYSWVNSIPENVWVFSRNEESYTRSVNVIMKLLEIDPPALENDAQAMAFRQLCGDDIINIPWYYVLSKKVFSQWCKNIVQGVCDALETFRRERYGETFIEGRALLRNLSRATVSETRLKRYLREEINPTNRKTLLSFMPDHAGFANQPVYDQLSTSTGRLILKTGPQVLTLPKKYRNLIGSRYEGGAVCQVDFVSLEPRVARVISGYPVGRDVYSSISDIIFKDQLTRDETKLAVLCALYGVSSTRLKNMLDDKADAVSVIRKIKEYFGTSELLKNMSSQISERGYVENLYGRKLNVQNESRHVWISHFIQSTATDAALIGFHRLINKIEKNELRVHGIFVIHDAILLDAHPDDEASLHELVREGIDLDEMGIFPLSMDIISRAQ